MLNHFDLRVISRNESGFRVTQSVSVENAQGWTVPMWDKVLEEFDNAVNNQPQLGENDSCYFHTSSKVPRYKYSEYMKNHPGLKRVIKSEKATIFVGDTKEIGMALRRFTVFQDYLVPYGDLKDKVKFDPVPMFDDDTIIHVSPSHEQELKRAGIDLATHYPTISLISHYSWASANVNNLMTMWDLVRQCKIIDDSNLIKLMSSERPVMDLQMYEQVGKMLESVDPATVSLAMEIMANMNFEESEFRILMLLSKYHDRMQQTTTYNNVNFKSLMTYFSRFSWGGGQIPFAADAIRNMKPGREDNEERYRLARESVLAFLNQSLGSHTDIFRVEDIIIKTNIDINVKAEEVDNNPQCAHTGCIDINGGPEVSERLEGY